MEYACVDIEVNNLFAFLNLQGWNREDALQDNHEHGRRSQEWRFIVYSCLWWNYYMEMKYFDILKL